MMLLATNDLVGGYTDTPILNGVSMSVSPGEIVTLVGPNGCGKSTLARAVAGLLPRVSGDILLNGQFISGTPAEDRLALGLSYVPQVANVFPNLTIQENLQVVEGVENRAERIEQVLKKFPALVERRHRLAELLSGGERQQLAVARALMFEPQVIVMDEPSAALSPVLVEQVFGLIQEIAVSGTAILLVEQRAREALAFSDRGYIMNGGKIVSEGPASELLADDRLAEMCLGH